MTPLDAIWVFSVLMQSLWLPITLHPYRSASGIGQYTYSKNYQKMVGNSASYPFNSWCRQTMNRCGIMAKCMQASVFLPFKSCNIFHWQQVSLRQSDQLESQVYIYIHYILDNRQPSPPKDCVPHAKTFSDNNSNGLRSLIQYPSSVIDLTHAHIWQFLQLYHSIRIHLQFSTVANPVSCIYTCDSIVLNCS